MMDGLCAPHTVRPGQANLDVTDVSYNEQFKAFPKCSLYGSLPALDIALQVLTDLVSNYAHIQQTQRTSIDRFSGFRGR